VPADVEPGTYEGGVCENLKQRVGPGNDEIQHCPCPGVPVPGEAPAEEYQADVTTADGALNHHQGLTFRQAAQGVQQDVGQTDHRQGRVPGMKNAAVLNDAGRGRSMAHAKVKTFSRHERPQAVAGRGRKAGQQTPDLSGGPVGTGIPRQGKVSAADPHNDAGHQACREVLTGKPDPLQGRRRRRSTPGCQECGKLHQLNLTVTKRTRNCAGAVCGQRRPIPFSRVGAL